MPRKRSGPPKRAKAPQKPDLPPSDRYVGGVEVGDDDGTPIVDWIVDRLPNMPQDAERNALLTNLAAQALEVLRYVDLRDDEAVGQAREAFQKAGSILSSYVEKVQRVAFVSLIEEYTARFHSAATEVAWAHLAASFIRDATLVREEFGELKAARVTDALSARFLGGKNTGAPKTAAHLSVSINAFGDDDLEVAFGRFQAHRK